MIIDPDQVFVLRESCLVGFKIGVEKLKKNRKLFKNAQTRTALNTEADNVFSHHNWSFLS